jgi:hypothetical protein
MNGSRLEVDPNSIFGVVEVQGTSFPESGSKTSTECAEVLPKAIVLTGCDRQSATIRSYETVVDGAAQSGYDSTPEMGTFDLVRRATVAWLANSLLGKPNQRQNGGCWSRWFDRRVTDVLQVIEPDSPEEAGALFNIVDGNVEPSSPNLGVTPSTPLGDEVRVTTTRKALKFRGGNKNQKALRVPILAGEVAALAKVRLGTLADNKENRLLVRSDIARRVEATRKEEGSQFENLRDSDVLRLVEAAFLLYWIPSDFEIEYNQLRQNKHVTSRDRFRQDLIDGSGNSR